MFHHGVRNKILDCLACVVISLASTLAHAQGWWSNSVMYQVFVRSFQDSNGDGIGDLRGITSRLDYFSKPLGSLSPSLGINALWLSPIFESPSYHGYDVTNYTSIDPTYGTMSDFQRLITESHRRGIRIVIDIPFNHTSIKHPWFKTSALDKASPQRDWYMWKKEDPHWPGDDHWHSLLGEFFYGFFSTSMPDLNLRNHEVVDELENVLRFWVKKGVDGFRLDAALHFIKGPQGERDTADNHALIRHWTTRMKSVMPQVFFVGEVWAGPSTIASYVNTQDELDEAFDFPVAGGLVESLRQKNPQAFLQGLGSTLSVTRSMQFLSPFITNHDMIRVGSLISDVAQLKLAATANLTLPGTPVVYYGEEIGMTNGVLPTPQSDLGKRTPMQWTTAVNHGFTNQGITPWNKFSSDNARITVQSQNGDKNSLFTHYQHLIWLKRTQNSLRNGSLELFPTGNSSVVGYARRVDNEIIFVLLNFADHPSGVFEGKISRNNFPENNVGKSFIGMAPEFKFTSTDIWLRGQTLPAYGSIVYKISVR